ncbi:hypothetical protein B9Y64_08270 [Stenotrophomonas maltophilia]|jgi:dephospho-CoA kinase|uniref:Dephospho-CoA kinase n=1 Tax=Stenotrophomonas maltophilia TaxID=40324 RepID=A0A2J0UDQ0_STEMA|nr:hypothetical protein B9Y64_08270 [Stenotrophomonas maltophilia]
MIKSPALSKRSQSYTNQMIAAQASRAQRLALADDVVVNDGHPEDLQARVEALHVRYLGLAAG